MQNKMYSSVGCSQTIFENHLAKVQQEKEKVARDDGRVRQRPRILKAQKSLDFVQKAINWKSIKVKKQTNMI